MTIVEQQVFLGRLDDSGPVDVNLDASLAIILLVGLWVVFFFFRGLAGHALVQSGFVGFEGVSNQLLASLLVLLQGLLRPLWILVVPAQCGIRLLNQI